MPPGKEEEFLFHLHQGSELLMDGREEEARLALERALRFRTRDAHTEGLLGVTYFRLGLYERALEIYERLVQENPSEASLAINLALVYFKTGQLAPARAALERAIALSPDHIRAHGYLGLVLSKMGGYAAAREAFERAGQGGMAQRMERLARTAETTAEVDPDRLAREEGRRRDLTRVAETAFHELEGEGNPFQIEHSGERPASDGGWQRVGGATSAPAPTPPPRSPAPPAVAPPPTGYAVTGPPPPPLGARIRELVLAFPEEEAFAIDPDGRLRVRVDGTLHCRLKGVLAMVGDLTVRTGMRRSRGQSVEGLLGPADAPLAQVSGRGGLVVDPGAQRFEAFLLDDELAYIREDALVAIDTKLSWENGRLPAGDVSIPLVNVRGRGGFVIATRASWSSIEVHTGRAATVPLRTVLGWTGRLLPRRAPPLMDGAPELFQFHGEGVLLLQHARREE